MDCTTFKNRITKEFATHIGINLSDKQISNFYKFMNMLIEKNKVMNLTAITDENEIIIRHFVDSCIMLKFYKQDFKDNTHILDIGTGAGFPGLPLAIMLQDLYNSYRFNLLLADSIEKRVLFVRNVINSLGLKNASVIHMRAEDLCHDSAYRETFDFALSRGVSKLSVLSEYCLPALKVNGKMISYKMDDIEQELSECNNANIILGGMFHEKHPYELISGEPTRCLVEIKKVSTTPSNYPRKVGIPAKKPL